MPSIVSSQESIVLAEMIQARNSSELSCTAAKVHNPMRAIRAARKSISCEQPRSQSPSDDGPQPRPSHHINRPLSRNLNKPLPTNNIHIKTHPSTKAIKHLEPHSRKNRSIRTRSSPIEPTCLCTFLIQASRKPALLRGHDPASTHTHICQRISEVK